MFKDMKNIDYKPYMIIAGGLTFIAIFLQLLKGVSELSISNKESETLIELPASPSPQPLTQKQEIVLDQNTQALEARSEVLAKADNVTTQITKIQKALDEQRALAWLLFAKQEAHKTQQTSREFLTNKLLSQIEELTALTNNQWLTTTSEKTKEFHWIAGESRAILIALTQAPAGSGADEKILTSNLFDALNQAYASLISENNLVRFESQQVLKRNLVSPPEKKEDINKDNGSVKAEEEDFSESDFSDNTETNDSDNSDNSDNSEQSTK